MTIIAEVGQNHCGNMELAKDLIWRAWDNRADLVKFQLYDSKELYGKYQDIELSKGQAFTLFNFGKEIGIEVFFSVFDVERVKWCEEMGVGHYKLASRKSRPVFEALVETGKHLFISLPYGKCPSWLHRPAGASMLYCIPSYPALPSDMMLENVKFGVNDVYQGLSDHTMGLDIAKIALARGAVVIEKHFAIDHKTGIDAEWSMTPEELRELKRFYDLVQEVL